MLSTYNTTSDSSVGSRKRSRPKRSMRRRLTRVIRPFSSGISRATRSQIYNHNMIGSQNYEIGIGVNSTGLLYTVNSATINTNTWPGYADITNLYDAYRVTGFQITATYCQNGSNNNQVTATLPFMYVTKDYNDISTASSAFSDVAQKVDCQQIALGRNAAMSYDYKGWVVPKIAQQAYSSATATGYIEPKSKVWISTSAGVSGLFNDVNHYGIKFWISTTDMITGNNIGNIRFYVKCFFELKHSN